jgi:hypothetical protein
MPAHNPTIRDQDGALSYGFWATVSFWPLDEQDADRFHFAHEGQLRLIVEMLAH